MDEGSRKIRVVAAIDIGTTYSGWAYSFVNDPTTITSKDWYSETVVLQKTPTAVLFKPSTKTSAKFGFDAISTYKEEVKKNNHSKWYYFSNFKMLLYDKMSLDPDIDLTDETGKPFPAKTVFSLAIRCLKEDMMKEVEGTEEFRDVKENNIAWVVTVPAIWNDSAKQFMRDAADEAGISSEYLTIALEPEAASIYCCSLTEKTAVEGGGSKYYKPGSRYMVLDAGGGTVDIAVHEVLSNGKIKELHIPTGGDWGGTQVDKAFKQFIISLVGDTVFERFKCEEKADFLEMFWEFEIKKRRVTPGANANEYITIPVPLTRIYKDVTGNDFCNAIKQTKYAEKVSLTDFKLRVDFSIMSDFYSKPIQSIVSHLKELMQDKRVEGVSSIVMVGGFSDSKMLQHAIRSTFHNVLRIIPKEAILAVLKGAVLFGHNPSSIAQRVCRYTYGIEVTAPFDKEKHNLMYRKEDENGSYCEKIFDKYGEVGQTFVFSETSKEKSYIPRTKDQTRVTFPIYASKLKSPMYVTDKDCKRIGCISIDIQDKSCPREERSFIFSMTFGSTEIAVAAKEKRTGNNVRARLNFLE